MSENFSSLTTMTVDIANHIAHIQLNRPDQHNTMNAAFWQELPEVVRTIDESAQARVIVISSTGQHFSAGMDLAVFANMGKLFTGEPGRRAEQMRRHVMELQDSFSALEQCRIPVLAAVQGGAIGGAVDMLCACDMRYCTENAFFSIKETQIGMTADVGTLQRIEALMAPGMVRELAYTGRDFMATEALRTGFVNQVFESEQVMLAEVMKIAQQIAVHSPLAVHGCKHHLNYARDHSVQDSLEHMATWQAGMFQMPDIQQAMQAKQTKSMPEYESLLPVEPLMKK